MFCLTVGCDSSGAGDELERSVRARDAAQEDTDAGEAPRRRDEEDAAAPHEPAAGGSGGSAAPKPGEHAGAGGDNGRRSDAGVAKDAAQGGSGGAAGKAPSEAGSGGAPAGKDNAGPVPTNDIETVGMDDTTDKEPRPVIMFRGGYATYNVRVVTSPVDVATDVVEHPDAWYPWRRTAEGLELQRRNGSWYRLPYKEESQPLVAGSRLDRIYEHGSVSDVGISAVIQKITRIEWNADGSWRACDGTKTTIVQTGMWRKETTPSTGKYEINGYTAHITNDDGSEQTVPLFTMVDEPHVIWFKDGPLGAPTELPDAICVTPN